MHRLGKFPFHREKHGFVSKLDSKIEVSGAGSSGLRKAGVSIPQGTARAGNVLGTLAQAKHRLRMRRFNFKKKGGV